MKKVAAICILGMGLTLISCNKDKGEINDDITITNSNTWEVIQDGSWRISYLWESDHDETDEYTGYDFSFGANNAVSAFNGAVVVSGIWYTGNDDSNTKLVINFGSTQYFSDLSKDWHVIELRTVKVRLEHVSGGGGENDYLTFEKN